MFMKINLEKTLHLASRPLAFIINNTFLYFIGDKTRPKFHPTASLMPELLFFDQNFNKVKEEFYNVYNNQKLLGYEKYDPNQNYIANTVDTHKKWNVFVFNLMGAINEKNLNSCPTIKEGLSKIPGYFQAMFSVLEPGKSIPAHHGQYMGYLRYHLGIKIPKENPPYIKVGDEAYTWREGESILIDDSWRHEVINNCKETRVVFIVDILRPLPYRILNQINHFIIHILIKNTYARKMKKNMEKIERSQINRVVVT